MLDLTFERLTPEHDVGRFDCGNDDLNDFLQSDALGYQDQHLAGTWVVFDSGLLVAFFSMSADAIPLDKSEPQPDGCLEKDIRTYPALKVGRLATQADRQGDGIGTEILRACIGTAVALRESHVGCRFVTVDANPDKVDWYLGRGFERNKYYVSRTKTSSLRYDILV